MTYPGCTSPAYADRWMISSCEKLHQESSGKNSGDSNRGPDLCVLQADNNTVYVQ